MVTASALTGRFHEAYLEGGRAPRTRNKRARCLSLLVVVISALPAKVTGSPPSIGPSFPWRSSYHNGRRRFEIDDMTEDERLISEHRMSRSIIVGTGIDFDLFDFCSPRGGNVDNSAFMAEKSGRSAPSFQRRSSSNRRTGRSGARSKPFIRPTAFSAHPSDRSSNNMFQSIRDWVASGNLPKIQCRVEPNTTLKVRKTFRPLKTIIRLGADFNTQLGVWQFRSSWEDALIGGKLTLAGRELQFTKTWLLSVGAVEDLVTRLRFRAAVDLGTMKAYARLGFRTERLSPINVVEGFTLMKQLPLDGTNGHVKLEVKANFAFPEPEIEYSTENHRSVIGMGDIKINIDELNLLLDY